MTRHVALTPVDQHAAARETTWDLLQSDQRTVMVDSPPGAGKSTLVRDLGIRWSERTQLPVVTQTNDQADDLTRAVARELGPRGGRVGRLHASTSYTPPPDFIGHPIIRPDTDIQALHDCDVVIAPGAKWAHVRDSHWPLAMIDEAYQMRSDLLMSIANLFDRLLLVGDPGQLRPFTTTDERLVRGLPLSPLDTAAGTILVTHPDSPKVALPVSWRLPPSAAVVISSSFYTAPFVAGSRPEDRMLDLGVGPVNDELDETLRIGAQEGWALLELPEAHLPATDPDVVAAISDLVERLLQGSPRLNDENGGRDLTPEDIAIGVTHKDQRGHVQMALASVCDRLGLPPRSIVADTANRLQGRQFEVVIAWHPLSGRRDASTFHLESGRLCVLLSRHRHACIVVTRGGIRDQLLAFPATDPIWPGEAPPAVDGWEANLALLDHLQAFRVGM